LLRKVLKSSIRHFGFDLERYNPIPPEDAALVSMLAAHGINLVLDVGANIGQFARSLRRAGYQQRIVSFEPLGAAREQMLQARGNDRLWEIAPRAAIGSMEGEVDIHVSGNSVSSSILPMLDTCVAAAPDSAYVATEKTPLRRLDSLAPQYIREDSRVFLKIDTQGFESQVLDGAEKLLPEIVGLHIELSLVPLYEGQPLYDELSSHIRSMGFELWTLAPGFRDPNSFKLLQVDATFFRS
jgi:FkbM family methyltransferase